jgi:hypothetical protein
MLLDISLTSYSYDFVPKIKASFSIETLINVYQTIRRHIQDDSCLHSHRHENHVYHPRLCDQQYQLGLDVNLRFRSNAVSIWHGKWSFIQQQKLGRYADFIIATKLESNMVTARYVLKQRNERVITSSLSQCVQWLVTNTHVSSRVPAISKSTLFNSSES